MLSWPTFYLSRVLINSVLCAKRRYWSALASAPLHIAYEISHLNIFIALGPHLPRANRDVHDQTVQMRGLIRAFADSICLKTRCLTARLIWSLYPTLLKTNLTSYFVLWRELSKTAHNVGTNAIRFHFKALYTLFIFITPGTLVGRLFCPGLALYTAILFPPPFKSITKTEMNSHPHLNT